MKPSQQFFSGRVIVLLAITVLALSTLSACSGNDASKTDKGKGSRKSTVPVITAVSRQADVPVVISATGRVEAAASAGIRSRVNGTLETVHFQEGQTVTAGAPLFSLDKRPYQMQLRSKEAALSKSQAELAHAEKELARYRPAAQKGLVSQEQLAASAVKAASLKATVQADQAAVDNARLDLHYCTLSAPFTGLAGEILADAGNLIKANADTAMVTINQLQPVHVTFTLPGDQLAELRAEQHQRALPVLLQPRQQSECSQPAQLFFIDNAISASSGAVLLKAVYPNEKLELWPGQMVQVRVQLKTRPNAVVVPTAAIQTGQQESYLYLVGDDQTVSYQAILPGEQFEGETVILQGLRAGQRIVVDGHLQLSQGVKVSERGTTPEGKKDAGKGEKP